MADLLLNFKPEYFTHPHFGDALVNVYAINAGEVK